MCEGVWGCRYVRAKPHVRNLSARNSRAGNGCADFMGAWHFSEAFSLLVTFLLVTYSWLFPGFFVAFPWPLSAWIKKKNSVWAFFVASFRANFMRTRLHAHKFPRLGGGILGGCIVATIHFSPFTCGFRRFWERSFPGFFRDENAEFTESLLCSLLTI